MKQLWMDWQTFAEEVGDAGQETGAVEGGQAAPDAGEQDDFAELIRGRYKAQFDARVQKILDGRLRGLRQENARLRQETQAHRERQAGALLRLQAEEERVVDNLMHDRYCELRAAAGHPCEGGKPLVIEGAYHEILFEKDAMRSVALNAIVEFFNRHT